VWCAETVAICSGCKRPRAVPRGRYTLTLQRRRGSVITTTTQTVTLG
jgi:hypothetical protein